MTELAMAMYAAVARRPRDRPRSERRAASRRSPTASTSGPSSAGWPTAGFRWLGRSDPDFPARLKSIHDPPPGLFIRGSAGPGSPRSAGGRDRRRPRLQRLRGARRALARAGSLAAAGVVVVSGLARGVDGWAHRGCLEAGGETVAVLGCGIDRDYPRAHAGLAREVGERGLVVSEYPPGVAPAPWRFPARNRIVAGLAVATVVVEARERSGALITADLALEEGREVLAVPGEITSALSAGSNALLRLGATPVTSPADVLEAIGVERPTSEPDRPAPGTAAAQVLAALEAGASTVDEIARATRA